MVLVDTIGDEADVDRALVGGSLIEDGGWWRNSGRCGDMGVAKELTDAIARYIGHDGGIRGRCSDMGVDLAGDISSVGRGSRVRFTCRFL